jgi:branched-chain amino acid transport system substrate-binding protein
METVMAGMSMMGDAARKKPLRLIAVGAVLVCLAACGSSGSASSGGSGQSSGGTGKLNQPISLALFWQVAGESPNADNTTQDGAQLAIDQINAAGGIGGKPVKWTRYPANSSDPQQSLQLFLQAAAAKPTALIGVYGTDQMAALEPSIARYQIPILSLETINRYGSPGTSQWVWGSSDERDTAIQKHVDFATQVLGLKHLGIMNTNESYGLYGASVAQKVLQQEGLKPFAVRSYSTTATDLTPQVLAMKGADGVLEFGYPDQEALQLKQFQQQGIDIPSIDDLGLSYAVAAKTVTGSLLSNAYGSEQPCIVAPNSTAPGIASFYAAYQAKWNAVPSAGSVQAYDWVYFLKAAVDAVLKSGKSLTNQTLNDALGTVTATSASNGIICVATMHADGSHFTVHQETISKYSADGSQSAAKVYSLPDIPKYPGKIPGISWTPTQ